MGGMGGMGGGDPFGGSGRRRGGGGMGGGNPFGDHDHASHAPPKPKPEDITRPLPVSLEDLYKGCTKKLRITRRMLSGGEEEKIVSVGIKAGWKKGTKVRYDGMGTEVRGGPAADVVCEWFLLSLLFGLHISSLARRTTLGFDTD